MYDTVPNFYGFCGGIWPDGKYANYKRLCRTFMGATGYPTWWKFIQYKKQYGFRVHTECLVGGQNLPPGVSLLPQTGSTKHPTQVVEWEGVMKLAWRYPITLRFPRSYYLLRSIRGSRGFRTTAQLLWEGHDGNPWFSPGQDSRRSPWFWGMLIKRADHHDHHHCPRDFPIVVALPNWSVVF